MSSKDFTSSKYIAFTSNPKVLSSRNGKFFSIPENFFKNKQNLSNDKRKSVIL